MPDPRGGSGKGWKGRQTQTPAGRFRGEQLDAHMARRREERNADISLPHTAHRHIAMQHTLLHACYAFAVDLGKS